MAIYAISDLHLALSINKPMDIFGFGWENYMEKIKDNWKSIVKQEDIVIIGGDVSWAMNVNEAFEDFNFINKLNGTKIISKGNHDYWWSTTNKINNFLKDNNFNTIKILHNNSYKYKEWCICGTRSWTDDDEKIFERELIRLEISLKEGEKIGGEKFLVSLHYPPLNERIIDLMKAYKVDVCIYGHLHGEGHKYIKNEIIDGIKFYCVASDYLKFIPLKISD